MKRARMLVSVGACALVALGVVATQPAAAQSAAAQNGNRAVATGGVVAAMQHDLGLTEALAMKMVRE